MANEGDIPPLEDMTEKVPGLKEKLASVYICHEIPSMIGT